MEYPPDMMYETYDEMDHTLARLHAPKFVANETVSLGPFGVFDGNKTRTKENGKPTTAAESSSASKKRKKKKDDSNQQQKQRKGSISQEDYEKNPNAIVTPISLHDTPNSSNEDNNGNISSDGLQGPGGFEEFFSSLTKEFPTSDLNSDMLIGNSTDPLGDEASYQILQDELSTLLAADSSYGSLFNKQQRRQQQRSSVDKNIEEEDSTVSTPQIRPSSQNDTTANLSTTSSPFPLNNNNNQVTPSSTTTPSENVNSTKQPQQTHKMASINFASSQHNSHANTPASTASPSTAMTTPTTGGPVSIPRAGSGFANHQKKYSTHQPSKHPFKSSLFIATQIPQMPFSDNKLGFSTTSHHFTPQARYLLDHYVKNVTRIMTVVIHPKNPWKTIYLPRACSAIGDLVGFGYTASARNALLHALLAVSAFHLQSKFPENSDGRKHYLSLGLQLKAEAYTWLSECLMKDLASQKYKDVITAVLSMVSIDVIWGSMTDCKVHLSACRSIVNMRCKLRPKISDKAAVLHRIAGFLSLMQNSASLGPSDITGMDSNKEFNDQWLDVSLEDLGVNDQHKQQDMNLPSLSYMNEESEFQEYWLKYKKKDEELAALSDEFYKKELISTHSLYGIPDSLILLFNRTCKLTKLVLYYRYKGESIPKDLTKQCSDLEGALVTWQNRYDVNKNDDFKGDLKEAVKHHTLSFHEALIIYYYRLVRDLNPTILQTHIAKVLDHLEQIQYLNRGLQTPICVPLIFPGFIAACEILTDRTDLRDRFITWMDNLTAEGLGTYYASREVVKEVWRRRDEGSDRANWWNVMVDWKINIMLS